MSDDASERSDGTVIDLFGPSDEASRLSRSAAVLRASLGRLAAAHALIERTRADVGNSLGEHLGAELDALLCNCERLQEEVNTFPDLLSALESLNLDAAFTPVQNNHLQKID